MKAHHIITSVAELRFVLSMQGVHEQFHGAQGREWQKDEKRFSRMVFIGRNIDDGLIQEGFEMCRADRQKKKKSLATSGSS